MRRIYLQQAMVAREKSILWETEMGLRISADQKRIVLRESKNTTLVRAGNYS
jgi:hypothetical protein